MPDLYVANCTTRNKEFCYRLPERERVYMMPVPAGNQVAVMRGAGVPDLEHVIRQHAPYGLFSADEIKRVPNTELIDAIFSTDKPVPVDAIMRADEHNKTVLELRGAEQRKMVALGINMTSEDTMPGVKVVETAITEEVKPGSENAFRHTVEVSKSAPQQQRTTRRKAA